jgi:hypothetical protein
LETTIAAEREALLNLPKFGEQYDKHVSILDTAIAEMKRVNTTAIDVNVMKKHARIFAKSIKEARKDVAELESTVHKNAKKLQDLAVNGIGINETTGEMDTAEDTVASDGASQLRSKAAFIKQLAVEMNVTGLQRSLNQTVKKFKKRSDTTFKEAKSMYEETKGDLDKHTKTLDVLVHKLKSVQMAFKHAKSRSMNMKVAELAIHALEKQQAAEVLREAEIRMKLGKERVARAKEVLFALAKAMNASATVHAKIKDLMSVPTSPASQVPTIAPSMATPVAPESDSPINQAIHNMVNHIVWGNLKDTTQMEEVLHKAFAAKMEQTKPKNISKNISQAMKFRGYARLRQAKAPQPSTTDHCHDGVKNFDEAGVDCGGSCTRQCGFRRVQMIPSHEKDGFHVVKNIIPNAEARGSQTETPQMVKSLKELLVPGADISTKSSIQFYGTVPIMNDGKFQEPKSHENAAEGHRFRQTWRWHHQKLRRHP